jgi:hypothetical protein
MGIPGNEIADEEAKAALDDLLATKNTHHNIWLTGSKQKTSEQEKRDGKIAKTIWKIGKKRSNGIKTRKRWKDETRP